MLILPMITTDELLKLSYTPECLRELLKAQTLIQ